MTPARDLGFSETFLHRFYTDLDGGLVTVVAAQLQNPIEPDQVRGALQSVMERHPLLRCRIETSDTGFHFAEEKSLHTPELLFSQGPTEQIFQELLNGPFAKPQLYWQVTAAEDPDCGQTLFLKIHHAIADGAAARSLLLEIIGIATGDDSKKPLPLRPSVESLVASGDQTFNEPLPTPRQSADWKFAKRTPIRERTCRSLLHKVDCIHLLNTAHQRGITVNSLLMEAVLRSAVKLPGFPDLSSLILPVSVRKRVQPPIPDDEMGCLIGNALVYAPDQEALQLPQLGAILGRQLEHAMGTAITGPTEFSTEMVDQAVAPFHQKDQDHFGFPLALSNLGAIPESKNVKALWFGASVKPGHLGILISASTIEKELCLGFHFAEPLLSTESVERFAQSVLQTLSPSGPPTELGQDAQDTPTDRH